MGEVECSMCLGNGVLENHVWCALQCGHGFHVACIDNYIASLDEQWINNLRDYPPRHEGCPLCREGTVRNYIPLRLTLADVKPVVKVEPSAEPAVKAEPKKKVIRSSDRKYVCDACMKSFTFKDNLRRHVISQHEKKTFKCEKCDKFFTRKDNISRHLRRAHKS